MIERYFLPEMAAIWSATHKHDMWLQVELLVCEGWAHLGLTASDLLDTGLGVQLKEAGMLLSQSLTAFARVGL